MTDLATNVLSTAFEDTWLVRADADAV